ncbi:MAG: hypothetical protein Ct9H300mP16_05410 [Pseudomonadota bacterium]|nr:MAG: hypothetical protein Ct9H300mP16_05410 [Pseudomonadota bacterium]
MGLAQLTRSRARSVSSSPTSVKRYVAPVSPRSLTETPNATVSGEVGMGSGRARRRRSCR